MSGAALVVCLVLCIMFGAYIPAARNHDKNMEADQ